MNLNNFQYFTVGNKLQLCQLKVDGDKFICLDNLINPDVNEECIIYSFGVNHDWSFEDHMDKLGLYARCPRKSVCLCADLKEERESKND